MIIKAGGGDGSGAKLLDNCRCASVPAVNEQNMLPLLLPVEFSLMSSLWLYHMGRQHVLDEDKDGFFVSIDLFFP